MLAAAKAPQIARGLLQMGENLAAPAYGLKKSQLGAINLQAKDALISEIESIASKMPDRHIGLRVLPDEQAGFAIGEQLPSSFKWIDGRQTDELLGGASSVSLGDGTRKEIEAAIKNAGIYESGPNGYYFGKKLAVIGGEAAEAGEDIGEKVITNAVIRALFDNPRFQK